MCDAYLALLRHHVSNIGQRSRRALTHELRKFLLLRLHFFINFLQRFLLEWQRKERN